MKNDGNFDVKNESKIDSKNGEKNDKKVGENSTPHYYKYCLHSRCRICTKCGCALHKKEYQGFKYWLRGVGYHDEPFCPRQ